MKYELSANDQHRLEHWHYHRANVSQCARFEEINNATRDVAKLIMERCPPGRQLDLALTHLEDVRMRANASIVLDEKE